MTDREAPRRILLALARQRVAHPDRALAIEAVIERGWPGERLQPGSAAGRVYTSIATLRRRGLRTIVVNVGDGYQIAPDVTVVLARGDEPELSDRFSRIGRELRRITRHNDDAYTTSFDLHGSRLWRDGSRDGR